jgi:hypothetical protein
MNKDLVFAILSLMLVGGVVSSWFGAGLIALNEGGKWLMLIGGFAAYAAFLISWISD